MINDNKVKALNGIKGKESLLEILKKMQNESLVSSCSSNYRIGYNSQFPDQFFAPFYLELSDGSAWIIYATNSIRTDRMCIQQWNSENIKRINSRVKKAIVIVPDEIKENEKENQEVKKYKEKIKTGKYYSFIDDVIYLSEFEHALKNNEGAGI